METICWERFGLIVAGLHLHLQFPAPSPLPPQKKKEKNPFTLSMPISPPVVCCICCDSGPNQNQSRLMDYNQKAVASPPSSFVGVAWWEFGVHRGSCTIRLLFGYMSNFYGHTQSNPSQPLYLRPKWFVCPWGIGKYV